MPLCVSCFGMTVYWQQLHSSFEDSFSSENNLNVSENETWNCANHKIKNKTSIQKWGRWQLHYFNSSTCVLITASSDQSNLPFRFVSLKRIEVIDNLSKLWVQLLDNISQLFQSVRANLRDVVHNYHIVDTVCCFGFLLYQVRQQLWNWKPQSKFSYISEKVNTSWHLRHII